MSDRIEGSHRPGAVPPRTAPLRRETAPIQEPGAEAAKDSFKGLEGVRKLIELAQRLREPSQLWLPGKPLSQAHNAHSTNTKEQMDHALEGSYNFFEGDIRREINPPHAMEMRHDQGHEDGDNLTLKEWLAIGKASGRGLKLDVKEGEAMEDILAEVEAADIPEGRLMFNLGDGDMAKWGAEIRRRFPDATLALNPPDGDLDEVGVDRMLDLAKRIGGPVTFVIRHDLLTDNALEQLQAIGPVSIWNDPGKGGVSDPAEAARELRERGVQGVVDLRESKSNLEKLKDLGGMGVSRAKSWLGGLFD